MTAIRLNADERRLVLTKLAEAIDPTIACRTDPRLPRYPSGVPDLDQHLNDLITNVAETLALPHDMRADKLIEWICGDCPNQFPQSYFPMRTIGGCVPRRFASQIVQRLTNLAGNSVHCRS